MAGHINLVQLWASSLSRSTKMQKAQCLAILISRFVNNAYTHFALIHTFQLSHTAPVENENENQFANITYLATDPFLFYHHLRFWQAIGDKGR